MESIISRYKIEYVWHFTDRANLASIEKHGGLFSRKLLDEKGIKIQVQGGNELSRYLDTLCG